MKTTLLLFTILIATATTAFGQNTQLKEWQKEAVQKLIHTFQAKNKARIAELIAYPLRREYPLKDVKDKADFTRRFDEIFDKEFLDHIARSKASDWAEVGWRGIMFDKGALWLDDEGKIVTINYQSPKEKGSLAHAVRADKASLPASLRNFDQPLYLILTKNYKIRIDKKKEDAYRYAAWKINRQRKEPDIVLENGELEYQGSGGNHTITFKNDGYTYLVSINIIGAEGSPDATLEVLKQERTILREDGRIKRN